MTRLLLAVTVLAVLPASASAQFFAVAPGGGTLVSSRIAAVHPTGALVVEWESDPETCAAHGRCGLRGVLTWRPSGTGRLFLTVRRVDGRVVRGGSLSLGGGRFGGDGDPVRTTVRRETSSGSAVCTDANGADPEIELSERDGLVAIGFGELGADAFLDTRCAGPVAADIAAVLPAPRLPYATLARGRTTLRLAGAGEFAAHGLRGRVSSTLDVRVGRPAPPSGFEPEERTRRFRQIVVRYRLVELRGEVSADLEGDAAACMPLDTCGVTGRLRLAPAPSEGEAHLVAIAPAATSRRALRSAVGLAPRGAGSGIPAFGFVTWLGGGTAELTTVRPGETPCPDTSAAGPGAVILELAGGRVRADHPPLVHAMRCAAPLAALAPLSAELPLRAFGERRVELRLTGARQVDDDGWVGASRGDVTVVLERAAVAEDVFRVAVD